MIMKFCAKSIYVAHVTHIYHIRAEIAFSLSGVSTGKVDKRLGSHVGWVEQVLFYFVL